MIQHLRTPTCLAFVLCAACTDQPEAAPNTVERDSAGIAIVENAWVESSDGWALDQERVVIGREGGPEELYQVSGATRLDDRRIVVVDGGTQEVRIYDANGRRVGSFGREGDGPGEFRSPSLVGARGDTLVLYDGRQRRVSWMMPDGTLVAERTIAEEGGGYPVPRGMFSDGAIAFGGGMSFSSDEGFPSGRIRPMSSFRAVPADTAAEPVLYGEFPAAEMWAKADPSTFLARGLPFGRVTVSGAADSLFWIGTGDAWELVGYGRSGSPRRIARVDAPEREVTAAMRDAFVEDALEDLPDANARRTTRAMFAEMPEVDVLPPYDRMKVDRTGLLWLANGQVAGEPVRWVILDGDGRLVGRLETPAGAWPLEIGADYMLLRATDELGIEEVRLHGLRRP